MNEVVSQEEFYVLQNIHNDRYYIRPNFSTFNCKQACRIDTIERATDIIDNHFDGLDYCIVKVVTTTTAGVVISARSQE